MNTVHVFRDGNAWVAKLGHPADGTMAWSDTPAKALLGLANAILATWHAFDHAILPAAFSGILNANTALLWREGDPEIARGKWHAVIGPDSTGAGLEATGADPGSALFALAQRVLQSGWRFHPEWRPE